MELITEIRTAQSNPEKLEQLYQTALKAGQASEYQSAIDTSYAEDPENVLFAAWHFRLQPGGGLTSQPERRVHWALAIPIGIVTGLIFWALSDFDLMFLDVIPPLVLWGTPIATVGALIYLAVASRNHYQRAGILSGLLLLSVVYVMLLSPGQEKNWQRDYLTLMSIHLPLMSWAAIGILVLGFKSRPNDRFAFLIRSIEVLITAGLYLIAGMAFAGITFGMFEALSVNIPEIMVRLVTVGGLGLLPVLAVATIYDPEALPGEQDFEQGLSKFIATMMRLLLPLTLLVLVIYIFVIPFNFMEPFKNRDVLIVYNLMLFAIMGLLIGATPIRPEDLSPKLQTWLRNGIITVAILAVLVSLYALSATVYRTIEGRMTINRLAIIGWNSINITILVALIYKQFKDQRENWVESLRWVFSWGTNAYVVWGVFLVVAIPLFFR